MKTFLLFILTLCLLDGVAQQKQDSVIIKDAWYKKDTLQLQKSLKDSLNSGSEMKIYPNKTVKNPDKSQRIKIINSQVEVQTVKPQVMEPSGNFEIEILGKQSFRRSRRSNYYHYFSGHLCGFNFGFINFANPDYSSYSAEDGEFMELDYGNSFVMQFTVLEQSFNFVPRNNFGLVFGLGLEYQRFRFDKKHTSITLNDNKEVVPFHINPAWNVKKNSFKTLYVTIPVALEVQFPARYSQRMYVSAGVMGGIRVFSRTKIVYKSQEGEKEKYKNTDDFSLLPVKADLIAKVGYGAISVWGSYTLTPMFRHNKGPELHPYAIGLGINF